MLDCWHLAIVLAIHKSGTQAEAAVHLHVTQSALSHAVRKLEAHYGVKIWQKEGRALRLTQAGEYLLSVAERLLPQLNEAEAMLRGFATGQIGKLRIGMECHPCYEWLLNVVSPFLERWPQVDLDVIQQFRFNGLQALLNHQVDMVVTSDPLANPLFVNEAVFEYELVLVTGTQWPQADQPWVEPRDLATQVLLTFPVARERLDVFTQFLTPARVEPKKQHCVEATEIMLQLVAAGRGVCTIPSWLARKYQQHYALKTFRLGMEGVHKSLYVVVREREKDKDYLRDFIALARRPQGDLTAN